MKRKNTIMRKSINEKYILLLSHLTRGAWIEKKEALEKLKLNDCRTSHEVRGLKSYYAFMSVAKTVSHLTRGAWIEKSLYFYCFSV